MTDAHERSGKNCWGTPANFIKAELKGIVGLRMQITRLDGTRKMSQNRNAADRAGLIEGLSKSDRDRIPSGGSLDSERMTNPHDLL